eukprot:EG_transcript_7350
MAPFVELPFDVLLRVFTFVPNYPFLLASSRVSQLWHQTAQHLSLWRQLSLEGKKFKAPLLRHLQEGLSGWGATLQVLNLYRCRICVGDVLELLTHCGRSLASLTLGHEGEASYCFSAELLTECLTCCPALQQLTLVQSPCQAPAPDDLWEQLQPLPWLSTVRLCNLGVSAATLAFLARLPALRRLALHQASGATDRSGLPPLQLSRTVWTAFVRQAAGLVKLEVSGVGAGSALLGSPLLYAGGLRCLAVHNGSPPLVLHRLRQPVPLLSFVCSETLLSCACVTALVTHAPQLQVLVVETLSDMDGLTLLISSLPPSLTTVVLDRRSPSLGWGGGGPADAPQPVPWDAAAALLGGCPGVRYWELLPLCWWKGPAQRPMFLQAPTGSWSRWQQGRFAVRPLPASLAVPERCRSALADSGGAWGLKDPRAVRLRSEALVSFY